MDSVRPVRETAAMGTGDGYQDASASATGYLYQINWALADLLQRGQARPDQALCIEGADDVVWSQVEGDPKELIQTKTHSSGASPGEGLGDKGVDIWKTLAIWLQRDDAFDPNGPDLTLVTTSVAPVNSAAAALVPADSADGRSRDVDRADALLATAAERATSATTARVRTAYLAVDAVQRRLLLDRVRVFDASFVPGDAFTVVRERLAYALPSGGLLAAESFLDQVWGWWYSTAVKLLAGQRSQISVMEVQAAVRSMRDQYGKATLPTTVKFSDVTPEHIDAYAGRRFVAQLEWVRWSPESLRLSIIDFHRAITQETHWLDHQLIGLDELEIFEENLRHEWEQAYAQMVEDLADLVLDADELEKAKASAGRQFARRVLDATDIVLRTQYQELWFARGKRHQLADEADADRAIGWHPDFRHILAGILTPPTQTAGMPA